ncbi:kinase-like protein [Microdochium trichocladiopsis]|uniref:Kinase-like protein n=1 Tax=Microdochium trichocladiopsis TaxID=1682393 RepID=A0A9P8XTQ1_9PEZI|nr:kinase-like protein [Microdochium trichocladiopsis]KAH7014406.1 kinase-like protein [Microdochium trichocladiopsis]
MTVQHRAFASLSKPALPPRQFPSSGFEIVDPSIELEEEWLPYYNKDAFYPVRIGEVLGERYQVITKLGWGTTSTVWLGHDLCDDRYVTLKVHAYPMLSTHELEINKHIDTVKAEHGGRNIIRMIRHKFDLQGTLGIHQVFVFPPLGVSLYLLQEALPSETKTFIPRSFAMALQRVLAALNFLHEYANITHTDVHSGNLLAGVADESKLEAFVTREITRPSARKIVDGATIHSSQCMIHDVGPLYLCDMGEARIGDEHTGKVMPLPHRAPEVILDMPWGHAIDMWSVGLLAWDLLQPKGLLQIYDMDDLENNDDHHLANLTALLGPPPSDFLQKSPRANKFWDNQGNWIGTVPIPEERTLESLETMLQGEEREQFLDLIRGLLCWRPEERLSSVEAFAHPWMSNAISGET